MTGSFANPLSRMRRADYPDAIDRLKAETRAVLGLSDEVVVAVTELACRDAECAGIETVVAVLIAGVKPRAARIHKPIPEVTSEDLAAAFATDQ
jgi:hypothetical protein